MPEQSIERKQSMIVPGQDRESPHILDAVYAFQWGNAMKPHFFPLRGAVMLLGIDRRGGYQRTRKNRRLLHHSRPICRSSNDMFWCHLLRLAGSSINKPQWKSLVSAVAYLTVSSSASRYLSQGQRSAHIGRAQKSQLKIKNINMYVPYHLPL